MAQERNPSPALSILFSALSMEISDEESGMAGEPNQSPAVSMEDSDSDEDYVQLEGNESQGDAEFFGIQLEEGAPNAHSGVSPEERMEPEKKKLPKKRKLQQEEDKPLGAIPTNDGLMRPRKKLLAKRKLQKDEAIPRKYGKMPKLSSQNVDASSRIAIQDGSSEEAPGQ